jgi:hypothetical protein
MRLPAFALLMLTTLCPAFAAAQTTLNKCIDAQGLVTYTNKPCLNAREVHKVEIDPAPLPDPVRTVPAQTQVGKPAAVDSAPPPEPAIHLETRRTTGKPVVRASARQCDTLSNKLGSVFDKMDQARRKGYTQEQMDKWNQEIKDLEHKKQQSGCF